MKKDSNLDPPIVLIGLFFISVSVSMYGALWGDNIFSAIGIAPFMFLATVLAAILIWEAPYLDLDIKWNKLFILAIPFILFNLIGALSPVTDADGAGYHLAMPKVYLENHKFIYHPDVVSNWPMSGEMIYTAFMSAHIPPKLAHLFFGIMLALLTYTIARNEFGHKVAAWAAVITYTIPMIVLESGIAYIDLFFTFYIIAGLYLAYMYSITSDKKDLFLSALFLGFGASMKWNGPVFVVLATAFLFVHAIFKLKGNVKDLLWYPLPGMFFSSLWYVKNWVLSGAPFVPFMEGVNWGKANIAAYLGTIRGSSLDIPGFIGTTWNLHFNGLALGELTWLGPIFAAFIPVLLFSFIFRFKKTPKSIKIGIIFSAIYYLFWYITSPQPRLLLPIIVIGAVFIAYVIRDNNIFKVATIIAILSALPFAVLYNGQSLSDKYLPDNKISHCGATYGYGEDDVIIKCDFITNKIPAYPTYQYINEHYPNASVLVYGDVHTYYLDAKYVWARPDMQGWITDYSNLSKYDITHVVINTRSDEFPKIKREIYENDMILLYEKNDVQLWRLNNG